MFSMPLEFVLLLLFDWVILLTTVTNLVLFLVRRNHFPLKQRFHLGTVWELGSMIAWSVIFTVYYFGVESCGMLNLLTLITFIPGLSWGVIHRSFYTFHRYLLGQTL